MVQTFVAQIFASKLAHGWCRVPMVFIDGTLTIAAGSDQFTQLTPLNTDIASVLGMGPNPIPGASFLDYGFYLTTFSVTNRQASEVWQFLVRLVGTITSPSLFVTAFRNGSPATSLTIEWQVWIVQRNPEKLIL